MVNGGRFRQQFAAEVAMREFQSLGLRFTHNNLHGARDKQDERNDEHRPNRRRKRRFF